MLLSINERPGKSIELITLAFKMYYKDLKDDLISIKNVLTNTANLEMDVRQILCHYLIIVERSRRILCVMTQSPLITIRMQ